MGAINQFKDSHGDTTYHHPYLSIEGTSARTRPFSFEEAILRRKNKNIVAELTEDTNQSNESHKNGDLVQVPEHFSSIVVPEHGQVSTDSGRGGSRKIDLKIERELSDRNVESSKRNKESKNNAKDNAEMRRIADKSISDRHHSTDRHDHHRRAPDKLDSEYQREVQKKHPKDTIAKDLDMERGRRSERDIRRQHDTMTSVKIKSEVHRYAVKKQTVHERRDVEHPEKRTRRYEEPNPKRRRSRSREYDRLRERSVSASPRAQRWSNRRSLSVSPRAEKRSNQRSPTVSPRTRNWSRQKSPSVSPRPRKRSSHRSPSASPKAQKRFHRRSDSTSPMAPKHSHRGHNQRSDSTSPRAPKHSHRGYNQRSDSTSPRAQRRSHHDNNGRGYVDSSSHALGGKSGKESSEAHRKRNGGSNRPRGSGLGGYSPRKRKTVNVSETMSPTHPSPERKHPTWDQPPADVVANTKSLTTQTNESPSSVPIADTLAKNQPVSISNTSTMSLEMSLDSVQLTQATRPKRRLYIENLHHSATDKAVIELLNDFLVSAAVNHAHSNLPCISCIINKEKCQAVVEFLTPEDATAALSLNGKSFLGSILKIRRPKDFVDAALVNAENVIDKSEVSHAISEFVKDSPRKIFIGGISKTLTSGMLMEIVRSFGTLKAYQFEVNESDGSHAFLEYLDPLVTTVACAGLNGMKFGGQVLTVVKAIPDWDLDERHAESLPNNEIPKHAKPLLEKPTKVLKFTNVFNMEDFMVIPDAELEEVLDDIRLECSRFGTVKSINAVRQVAVTPSDPSKLNFKKVNMEVTATGDLSETESKILEDAAPNPQASEEDILGNPVTDGYSTDKETIEPPPGGFTSNASPVYIAIKDKPQLDFVETASDNSRVRDISEAGDRNSEIGSPSKQSEHVNLDVERTGVYPYTYTIDVEKPLADEEAGLQADLNSLNVDIALADGEEKQDQTSDALVFEVGCVLVEFMREEAACMAAHCLNRRPYDGRAVEISYVAHNVYLEQFRR